MGPGENSDGYKLASRSYGRVNADFFAVLATALEGDHTISQSIEGVIFAYAYVVTSMYGGTALTDKDVASSDYLSAITLHAQALGI